MLRRISIEDCMNLKIWIFSRRISLVFSLVFIFASLKPSEHINEKASSKSRFLFRYYGLDNMQNLPLELQLIITQEMPNSLFAPIIILGAEHSKKVAKAFRIRFSDDDQYLLGANFTIRDRATGNLVQSFGNKQSSGIVSKGFMNGRIWPEGFMGRLALKKFFKQFIYEDGHTFTLEEFFDDRSHAFKNQVKPLRIVFTEKILSSPPENKHNNLEINDDETKIIIGESIFRPPAECNPDQTQALVSHISRGEKKIFLIDCALNKVPLIFKGHTDVISCMRFNPDESLIASGGQDKTLRIWHKTKRKCIILFSEKTPVQECIFSNNGKYLAFTTKDTECWHTINPRWAEIDNYLEKKVTLEQALFLKFLNDCGRQGLILDRLDLEKTVIQELEEAFYSFRQESVRDYVKTKYKLTWPARKNSLMSIPM
jgi:hypothetical protein